MRSLRSPFFAAGLFVSMVGAVTINRFWLSGLAVINRFWISLVLTVRLLPQHARLAFAFVLGDNSLMLAVAVSLALIAIFIANNWPQRNNARPRHP